jgi:hypothetical protein
LEKKKNNYSAKLMFTGVTALRQGSKKQLRRRTNNLSTPGLSVSIFRQSLTACFSARTFIGSRMPNAYGL